MEARACQLTLTRTPHRAQPPVSLPALHPVQEASRRRVALVSGNKAYTSIQRLPNPPNDVAELTAALKRLGFSVTIKIDAESSHQMIATAREGRDTDPPPRRCPPGERGTAAP